MAGALALLAATAAVYENSFDGVLLFDDRTMLRIELDSSAVRSPYEKLVRFGGKDSPAAGRPVTALSFFANLAWEGAPASSEDPAPTGYHAFNLAVHGAAALCLFALVRRTLLRLPSRARHATALAFLSSLAWTAHPLLTATITYVSQRAEALMGLFLLASLLALARSLESERPLGWRALSILACAASLASKEVGATTPILLLLYDRAFASGSFRAALSQRRGFYVAAFGTWLITLGLLATDPRPDTVVWSEGGLDPLDYALTQSRAIWQYARMVLWPWPLYFDHGWPVIAIQSVSDLGTQLSHFGPSLLGCILALAATAWLVVHRPAVGFLPAAWFVILAPSSSVLPVHTEIVALHRVYLPAAALLVGIVAGAHTVLTRAAQRWRLPSRLVATTGALAWIVFVGALGLEARAQNRLYASELAFWEYNLRHTPDNPRVLLNLGRALVRAGHPEEGRARIEQAVEASLAIRVPAAPMLAHALAQAAEANLAAKRWEEALDFARRGIELDPDEPAFRVTLGSILAAAGRLDEAVQSQRDALALRPDLDVVRWNLIGFLLELRRFRDAEAEAALLDGVDGDPVLTVRAVESVAGRLKRLDLLIAYRRFRG